MTRLLITLVLILGVCLVSVHFLESRQLAKQRQASSLRLVAAVAVEQVEEFWLQQGSGPQWTFVKRGHHWRYPAYFNAYAQSDRLEFLLTTLAQTAATIVQTDATDLKSYGLDTSQALKIGLKSGSGATLLEAWIGHGVPVPGSGEAYIRRAGNDTIFHLHANPRTALDPGDPPLLDRLLRPKALNRKALVRIAYERQGAYPLKSLRRIETAPDSMPMPGRPPQGPSYAWLAAFDAGEDTCLSTNVFTYLNFLERLSYAALHDPDRTEAFESVEGRLTLEDEEGTTDILEMGGKDPRGLVYWRHRQTGQVFSVAAQHTDLLFPTRPALMDSLSQPTPYQGTSGQR
jgi:hypothetical protein